MLSVFSEPSLAEMVAEEACFRMPRGSRITSLVQETRRAEERARNVVAECQQMFHTLGEDEPWSVPTKLIEAQIAKLDIDAAREECRVHFEELAREIGRKLEARMEEAANANHIGEIEWFRDPVFNRPKGCRFHFYERQQSRTLTTIRERTVRLSHEVVDAKRHRLPARSVRKPKRCREIIAAMPAFMCKHSYIVTGTQILSDEEQLEATERPNELVQIGRSAAGLIGRSAAAVARASHEAYERVRNIDIVRDPALVIGKFVLVGWND